MLESLSIKNVALIDSLNLEFSKGFNVLSGESGAGKSILIGSISFLLGGKANVDIIREGEEEASVSAIFSLSKNNERAYEWLNNHQIDLDGGTVLLRRSIKRGGRSLCWIQGVQVSRTELSQFSEFLIDIHGQHDHQSLFRLSEHRRLLDGFSGIEKDVSNFTKMYTELAALREKYSSMLEVEKEKKEREDFLSFAIEEIEKAGLKVNEEEQLKEEEVRLSQFEKLFDLLNSILLELQGDKGAVAKLRRALKSLEDAKDMDKRLASYAKRLETSFYEDEDILDSLSSYHSNMSFSPSRLEEVEGRLSLIYKLKKKYGSSIKEILLYYENAKKTLEESSQSEYEKLKLLERIKMVESSLLESGRFITKMREENTKKLQVKVEEVLKTLGMKNVRFGVKLITKEEEAGHLTANPYGFDDVEFMISANEGESLKPLAKIASGGEISRVMLSLKTILASNDDVETLIFDEIDTGIGGEVALSVAHHIKELSFRKQILSITHLAIIASSADKHTKVEKCVKDGCTFTYAFPVEKEKRVEEIARMLAGDEVSEASLNHALELLKKHSSSFLL